MNSYLHEARLGIGNRIMASITRERQSMLMARVRAKDTRPEHAVRKLLHRWGFRFRLHRRDLPGTPDLVLPRFKLAIFVHGCFWHQHASCPLCKRPRTNLMYWEPKFARIAERDRAAERALQARGWTVAVIWECETISEQTLHSALRRTLDVGAISD
jgi:DNA mismatch endonuclease (patch repair protein)